MGRLCDAILVAILFSTAGCGGGSSSPTTASPPMPVYTAGEAGVTLPTLVKEVKPFYPAEAVAARIQGTVLLSAVVLPDGTVGEVTVIRSLDTRYGLDAQAVIAARQWLFNPGTKDGKAVAVRVTIEMTFTLR